MYFIQSGNAIKDFNDSTPKGKLMFQVRLFLMVSAGRLQWCTENLLNAKSFRNEIAQTARMMFPKNAECGVAFWPLGEASQNQPDEQVACAFLLNLPDPIQPSRNALYQYVLIISAQDYRANRLNPFTLLRTLLTPEIVDSAFPHNATPEKVWQAYENNERITVIDNHYGECEPPVMPTQSQEDILKSFSSNLEEVETYLAACLAHPDLVPPLCFSVENSLDTVEAFLHHPIAEQLENLYLCLPSHLWTRLCWAVCQDSPDLNMALKSQIPLSPKSALPPLFQKERQEASPQLGTTIIYGEETDENHHTPQASSSSDDHSSSFRPVIVSALLIVITALLAFYAGTFFGGNEQQVLSQVKNGFLSTVTPPDFSVIENETVPEALGQKLGKVVKNQVDKPLSMKAASEKEQLQAFKAAFFEAYQTEKYDYTKALSATTVEQLAQNMGQLFHEKDIERSKLKRKMEAKKLELSQLETDLGEQTAKIEILHEQKKQHWAKVAQLETDLDDKSGEIDGLKKKIEKEQHTIAQLEKTLTEENQESEASLNQYETGYSEGQKNCYVYQERSWSLGCGNYIQGCKKVCK